jgi:hypothetical protein
MPFFELPSFNSEFELKEIENLMMVVGSTFFEVVVTCLERRR